MRGCPAVRADRGRRQLSPRPRYGGRPRFPGRRQRRQGGDGPHGRLTRAWPKCQSRGETKLTARLRSGLHVDLRVVPAESFGARAAVLHRLEGPQRRRPRAGQGPRPEGQRIRRLPRRRADRRPHGGRGLRRARSALLSARDARGPPRVRVGGRRQAAATDRAGRHPRRPAHAQHLDRRPGHHRRDGPGGQGPRAEIHRHDRPLQAGDDGQRAGRNPASQAVGGNRQTERAAHAASRFSRA